MVGEFESEIGFFQAIELSGDSLIYAKQSKYQAIEVHRSKHYGNVLVLDDAVQLTERDGNSYNEMMAHIPLFQHPEPKRVLIVGGGDGYVLSEVRAQRLLLYARPLMAKPKITPVFLVGIEARQCRIH